MFKPVIYEDLLGKQFEYGARGPDKFDCWGLVMEMLKRDGVYPEDYGWHNEASKIQSMMLAAEQKDWQQCPFQPRALVLFKIGRFVRHVGYIVSFTQFIHCWENTNEVVVENLSEDWTNRIVGVYQYAPK